MLFINTNSYSREYQIVFETWKSKVEYISIQNVTQMSHRVFDYLLIKIIKVNILKTNSTFYMLSFVFIE